MNTKTATPQRNNVTDFAAMSPPKPSNVALVPAPTQPPHSTETKTYPPKIAKALIAIAKEFGAIEKDGTNSFHKYNYQKWEDVLNRVSELLPRHGLMIQQSEVARSLFENDQMMSITYAFTIFNQDGEVWPDRPVWSAVARARDQKGVPDDKSANKCHTQAHKYFLLHTFNIKTRETVEDDTDAEVPDRQIVKPKPPKPGSQEAKAMEGPRELAANGAVEWAGAFVTAIERAETIAEIDQWCEANEGKLAKLANFPQHEVVKQAIAVCRKMLVPKPPKPQMKPQSDPMPDPNDDPDSWLAWLKRKYAAFPDYQRGEDYWNDVIVSLDLPESINNDAMGVWRQFEHRFES